MGRCSAPEQTLDIVKTNVLADGYTVFVAVDSRQQMIVTAARLFERDGYHATSWRGLVQEAGAPWGSIHHHFPGGKTELGVAALEAGSAGVIALIDHCFAEQPDAAGAVGRWFELSARMLVDTAYESGCPVATVALETLSGPDEVKNAARAALGGWEARLASHLRGAGLSRARASDAAAGVLALMEGALLLSRVHADVRPMRVASRHAQAIVAEASAASRAARK
jgi:TetR/AcrR family transcriptional repressor of lmrAB and yxaGH operons